MQPLDDYLVERIGWSFDYDACWPWLLSTGSHGYGQGWDGQTVVLAHRLVWTFAFGEIPDDLTVDHRCHHRSCCNPFHLRLKTNVDNARDNGMATRTHCPLLHAYDEGNTYVDPEGHRRCRACARINARRRAHAG